MIDGNSGTSTACNVDATRNTNATYTLLRKQVAVIFRDEQLGP